MALKFPQFDWEQLDDWDGPCQFETDTAFLDSDFFVETLAGGASVKVWDGAAWVQKPVKVWDGLSWVLKPMKVFNGSAWVGG